MADVAEVKNRIDDFFTQLEAVKKTVFNFKRDNLNAQLKIITDRLAKVKLPEVPTITLPLFEGAPSIQPQAPLTISAPIISRADLIARIQVDTFLKRIFGLTADEQERVIARFGGSPGEFAGQKFLSFTLFQRLPDKIEIVDFLAGQPAAAGLSTSLPSVTPATNSLFFNLAVGTTVELINGDRAKITTMSVTDPGVYAVSNETKMINQVITSGDIRTIAFPAIEGKPPVPEAIAQPTAVKILDYIINFAEPIATTKSRFEFDTGLKAETVTDYDDPQGRPDMIKRQVSNLTGAPK